MLSGIGGSQMKGPTRWYAVLGGVCVIAVLAAACGGSESEAPKPTPSGTPSGVLQTRTPPVLSTVDPNVSLVTYESAEKGYSIGYPEGWEIRPGSAAVGDFFVGRTEEGRILAQFGVTRVEQENLTADVLIQKDVTNLVNFGGRIDPRTAVPITVGGVEGKQLRYFVHLGELTVEHIVAYAVVGEAGWRIGLNSYGSRTLDPYVPLFERIIESFRSP